MSGISCAKLFTSSQTTLYCSTGSDFSRSLFLCRSDTSLSLTPYPHERKLTNYLSHHEDSSTTKRPGQRRANGAMAFCGHDLTALLANKKSKS